MTTPTQPTEGAMRAAWALARNGDLYWAAFKFSDFEARKVALTIDAETGAAGAMERIDNLQRSLMNVIVEKGQVEDALHQRVKALEDALRCYRFAYTPDGHSKPHDCFATGPLTGDPIQDLIACPGCRAEKLYHAALQSPTSAQVGTEEKKAVSAKAWAEAPNVCLNSEVPAAITDTRRLDWLEDNQDSPSVPYAEDGKWCVPYLDNGAGGFGGGVNAVRFTSLRAAIDSAMEGTEEAT
jgi:hypothetical protein